MNKFKVGDIVRSKHGTGKELDVVDIEGDIVKTHDYDLDKNGYNVNEFLADELELVKSNTTLKFKPLSPHAILPTKAHATDSGFDLYASEDVVIAPGETVIVKTGIAIDLPIGHEAQVRPRSGVTSKTKLRVQLGTIDNEYTGEIGIIVDNITPKIFVSVPRLMKPIFIGDNDYHITKEAEQPSICIKKGDKLAQLVVQYLATFETSTWIDEIEDKQRGADGFGSSGTRNSK